MARWDPRQKRGENQFKADASQILRSKAELSSYVLIVRGNQACNGSLILHRNSPPNPHMLKGKYVGI